ncbi:MAG TPA: polyprenyl synthetase family protein [Epulopiscium sp.]|nr:polyprenyl synthetase family protein [Candidatus Epulonipiscium sp.]
MAFWSFCPLVSEDIEHVNNYMKKSVVSRKQTLTNISQDLIDSGGKRLRSGFLILAAHLGEYNRDDILPFAAAVELIHTATLVHDDIIDESSYRRNNQTIHEKWGRDMAIYTGDYLFTKSFAMLSDKDVPENNYLNKVAHAMQSICEGEIDQYEQKYKIQNVYDYLKRIHRKSAVLFALSSGVGAQQAGCSNKIIRHASTFALHYGVAFQIYDDLLDYTDTELNIGKPIGNDIKEGNYTLPIIYALEDPTYGDSIQNLLLKKDAITDAEIQTVIQYVNKTDAINQSTKLAFKFLYKAESRLNRLPNKPCVPYFRQILYDLFPSYPELKHTIKL